MLFRSCNFPRELILVGAASLASPETFVIEVLEDVAIDDEVVAACRDLHERGYAIGLDDFVENSDAEALLPYVKFIKIDVLQTAMADVTRMARRFVPSGLTLIAEKVETAEMAEAVTNAGCHLLQGHYFCRPTTFSKSRLPSRYLVHMRLLEIGRAHV